MAVTTLSSLAGVGWRLGFRLYIYNVYMVESFVAGDAPAAPLAHTVGSLGVPTVDAPSSAHVPAYLPSAMVRDPSPEGSINI